MIDLSKISFANAVMTDPVEDLRKKAQKTKELKRVKKRTTDRDKKQETKEKQASLRDREDDEGLTKKAERLVKDINDKMSKMVGICEEALAALATIKRSGFADDGNTRMQHRSKVRSLQVILATLRRGRNLELSLEKEEKVASPKVQKKDIDRAVDEVFRQIGN